MRHLPFAGTWDRIPFAGRLLFTASLALVIAALVMLYTSARREAQEAEADLRAQLQAELAVLPPSLAELLVIGDFSTLQQTLDSHVRRANVARIRYQDTSGAMLESRETQGVVRAPQWFVGWLGLGDMIGKAAAEIGGRNYGQLEVTITAHREIDRAWQRLVQHLFILLLAIALDFVGIWLILRNGLRPLHDLSEAARALGQGDFSARIAPRGSPELRRTVAAFNRMADSLDLLMEEVRVSQAGLSQSEERFREALEHAPIGMAIVSTDGRFVQVNRALCDILGYSPQEMLNLTFVDISHPDDLESDLAELKRLESGEIGHYEIEKRYLRKGGEPVWTQLTASMLRDTQGRPRQVIKQVQDISERKRLEAQLRELNESLERRVEEEVAKNRDKDHILTQQARLAAMGEMIHNIAHQWRQPLNSLSIMLSNIKDDFDAHELTPEIMEQDVRKARGLLQRMSTTIDDFRDFFRPDREPGVFELGRAVDDALFVIAAALANNQIEVEKDLPHGICTNGFSNQFAQVVMNLLANAKDAIQQRKVAQGRIALHLRREDGDGVLTIQDNAGGIPSEVMERMFDPYFTTKDQGSGIGLYMSRTIIERNFKGKIEAANAGPGALITIRIPLVKETQAS